MTEKMTGSDLELGWFYRLTVISMELGCTYQMSGNNYVIGMELGWIFWLSTTL